MRIIKHLLLLVLLCFPVCGRIFAVTLPDKKEKVSAPVADKNLLKLLEKRVIVGRVVIFTKKPNDIYLSQIPNYLVGIFLKKYSNDENKIIGTYEVASYRDSIDNRTLITTGYLSANISKDGALELNLTSAINKKITKIIFPIGTELEKLKKGIKVIPFSLMTKPEDRDGILVDDGNVVAESIGDVTNITFQLLPEEKKFFEEVIY